MSAIDQNDFWAACMQPQNASATDHPSLWGNPDTAASTAFRRDTETSASASGSDGRLKRQHGEEDTYLQELQQKLNSVLNEGTNPYQQQQHAATPPTNYHIQPSFTVVSGENRAGSMPPPPFSQQQTTNLQAYTAQAQLQGTAGGMQFQPQQAVMGGAPVAMVLIPGTNQIMMLPQGAMPMMMPSQQQGGGFVMPPFAPQLFQPQQALSNHTAAMQQAPRNAASNGGTTRGGNRQRSSNHRNQQHQQQQQQLQQQQMQQQNALLQAANIGSMFPLFPMAPAANATGGAPVVMPITSLTQMAQLTAAGALPSTTAAGALFGMHALPPHDGGASDSNGSPHGSPNTSPASLQQNPRGGQQPSVPREPGNRPNHSTNVHDALAGKCQFHAYRTEPNRKPPPRTPTGGAGSAEQTLPIFVQMFPSEWIQHAQAIFQEIIRCICGASPDGKGDGVVESMDRRSETSFIVHVRTSHVWDLISKLRCRVLMDRHGFWYAHQWSTYVDMKEYCESVRKMPQQQRHYKTDGLPCMPLVVELGRTVAADTVILAAPPTSVPFDTLMPMAPTTHQAVTDGSVGASGGSHHHHGRGSRRNHNGHSNNNNNSNITHQMPHQMPALLPMQYGGVMQHMPMDHRPRGKQPALLF